MSTDADFVRRIATDATNLAVLAVARRDATIHASLVSAGVINDPVTGTSAVGVVVGGSALKLRHLRRTRRAVAVFNAAYDWVAVEGHVTLAGPDDLGEVAPEALPLMLRDVFVAAGGSHGDWEEYDRVMAADRRVAVYIDMERVTTNR